MLAPVVAAVTAQTGRGDGSLHFVAPPLQIANLAACVIFLFVALIQFEIARRALFRPWARFVAAGAAVALTILIVSYTLGVALIITSNMVDHAGLQHVDTPLYHNIRITSLLFYRLADPAIFALTAFLLYNRYCTVHESSSPGFVALACMAGALLVLTVALLGADTAISGAALTTSFNGHISMGEEYGRIWTSGSIFYAEMAFHILATLLLAVSTFLVKARTRDEITSLTLITTIPLISLHALARVIFAIAYARIRAKGSFAIDVDVLNLAGTLTYGVMYLGGMSVLVFLLHRAQMWDVLPPYVSPTRPQFASRSPTAENKTASPRPYTAAYA